ncbi:uncharacterized protein LOC113867115 isoform X2 [Abrus precatorius]|nr:uncharacterized protein LOC113867115 isoform X2 [Abrus precatorius]
MPNSKLHLIASENNGGFPSAKKGGNGGVEAEQKHEKTVPGLVARLMGLESMPPLQQDKSLEFSFSDSCGDEPNNEEVDLEIVFANSKKHDSSRPRKIQKTGKHERRIVVTRFGSEALQIKKVLSRARKYNDHRQHKLVSPLKSPRIASRKSASRRSRLIGAATKILEPGLQATSRAKCSLPSSTSINYSIVTERVGTRPLDVKYQCGYDDSTGKSLMGHAYCRSCGNLLDAVDYRPEVEGQQVVFTSSLEKAKSFIPSHENDVVLLRSNSSKEKLITLVNEDKNNVQYCNESSTRRMSFLADRDSSCQPCGTLDDNDEEEASSCSFKCKTQTQVQALSREKISYGSRVSNVQVKRVSSAASAVRGTKDLVTLNRSLSGRTSMRSPTEVDSSKFDLERKPPKRYDSSSPVRTFERKMTPNVSQVGGTASSNLVTVKQGNVSSGARGGTIRGFDASSRNSSNAKSKQDGQRNTYKVDENKVNEVVSFTFNSPFKQKIIIPGEKGDTSSDNVITTCFQRPPPLTSDAFGSFLEQKLKELSTQENELDTDGPSKKSITMILQELLTVLNSRHLTCSNDHISNDKYRENHGMLLGTSCSDNHLSPGSVLEASFSSSSLDESSGHGFHLHYYMNCSYDQLEQLEHDIELLDSATSFNKGKKGYEILTELINQVPRILQSLNSFRIGLTESKLTHVKDVILNTELVLGNAIEHSEDEVPQLLISYFLLDELDTMPSNAMWTDLNGYVGCEESKEGNQLKAFVFDCVIEFLESNCCQYYHSVFKAKSAWIKLPLCMKAKMLVQEFKNEIKKWACVAGLIPDEIIEWEMSHSLGKWTDFNIEAFEAGVDIDGDVLQVLVDEIVQDLLDFSQ